MGPFVLLADGCREARPAGRGVQERLPRRTDVPVDLRLCLRRACDQPAPTGDPLSDVLIAGVMAGFLVVLIKMPFTVILLTVVMLQASPELTALIVLAVAAVMIVSP